MKCVEEGWKTVCRHQVTNANDKVVCVASCLVECKRKRQRGRALAGVIMLIDTQWFHPDSPGRRQVERGQSLQHDHLEDALGHVIL